jgi:hypothetical protein
MYELAFNAAGERHGMCESALKGLHAQAAKGENAERLQHSQPVTTFIEA